MKIKVWYTKFHVKVVKKHMPGKQEEQLMSGYRNTVVTLNFIVLQMQVYYILKNAVIYLIGIELNYSKRMSKNKREKYWRLRT